MASPHPRTLHPTSTRRKPGLFCPRGLQAAGYESRSGASLDREYAASAQLAVIDDACRGYQL
ncbi:hypothetical protein LA76x_0729 [Lysobacter antibioticus]|uniref:Uncharacterized protein n=1 Tax=Lysobacter antibioticus TaxID=84531 RepID=A0A0S2F5S3_LYSAN|nr:hypothetical protein LA76x_0729 [Lysobacter antibioticus]